MAYFRTIEDNKLPVGTSYWIKYIKSRIDHNKNFMGCFIGQTGSGKSYSALSLQELLEAGVVDTGNIFFKAVDFMKKLMDISDHGCKKGTVLVWDEAGKDLNAKQWQAKANRVVSIVMQVFRKENLIVLFTLPYFSFLDPDARKLVHATFETQGIDYKTSETIVKPLLIQTNQDTGKMYKKFLRVNANDQGIIPVKKIRLPMPNPEIVKEYEDKKSYFTKQVYKEAYEDLKEYEQRDKSKRELTEDQKNIVKSLKDTKCIKETAKLLGKSSSYVSLVWLNARKKLKIGKFEEINLE